MEIRNLRVAVLSITRDRIGYTKHCFGRLDELAGYPFDHYVFDNGSQDGTQEYLSRRDLKGLILSDKNLGICVAMNRLLDLAGSYDYIIKFDNDCELTDENTLGQIVELMTDKLILSPRIEGLRSPPGVGEVKGRLGYPAMIGGIFMCVPGWVYQDYRYNEGNPVWGMDDVNMCNHFANQGGRVAYVMDLTANHYETTDGQWARYPDYFATKISEGLPV